MSDVWSVPRLPMVVVAFLAAAVCCGGDHRSDEELVGGQWARTVPIDDAAMEWLVQQQPSDLVLELVSDGQLTFEDYEQLMLAMVACGEDIGWELSAGYPRLAPWGEYQIKFRPLPRERAEERGYAPGEAALALQSCERDYWRSVGRLWFAAHQPTEQQLSAARADVAACLLDAGVGPVEDLGFEGMQEAFVSAPDAHRLAWNDCIARAEATHFTSGFGVTNVN